LATVHLLSTNFVFSKPFSVELILEHFDTELMVDTSSVIGQKKDLKNVMISGALNILILRFFGESFKLF